MMTASACVVLPQTYEVYDPECKVMTRQVTLQAAYVGGFQHCAGEGCASMLAAAGVVTAASLVVSGSIALVGNVVYWIERQGNCKPTQIGPYVAPQALPPPDMVDPPVPLEPPSAPR